MALQQPHREKERMQLKRRNHDAEDFDPQTEGGKKK
jgi:hypothetical protein